MRLYIRGIPPNYLRPGRKGRSAPVITYHCHRMAYAGNPRTEFWRAHWWMRQRFHGRPTKCERLFARLHHMPFEIFSSKHSRFRITKIPYPAR